MATNEARDCSDYSRANGDGTRATSGVTIYRFVSRNRTNGYNIRVVLIEVMTMSLRATRVGEQMKKN